MRSVVARDGKIVVEERPRPEPGPGEVLVKSLACGICGSDLHLTHNASDFDAVSERTGMAIDVSAGIPLGHEFVAEVVEFGPDTDGILSVGQRVCSLPFLLDDEGDGKGIGTDAAVAGAYSEYFLLSEALMIPLPDDLPNEAAALVEPLAVGIHAVARSGQGAEQAALVVGCGPIGLATITTLVAEGVESIVAVDPVAGRRELAQKMGATHLVDPADGGEMDLVADLAGEDKCVVIYECVGRPAIFSSLIDRAPMRSCIVYVGLCTEEVSILPFVAMQKELDLLFAFYYAPDDFMTAVQAIADGAIDWKLWVTAKVGIDGVAEAFEALSSPNDHVKILVEPWGNGRLS
jgi:2-desacetyl-2-hydroxyethyl bacteriochlorophyllide A dehydrogenase